MNKTILAIIMLGALLAGCASPTADPTARPPQAPAQPTPTAAPTAVPTSTPVDTPVPTPSATSTPEPTSTPPPPSPTPTPKPWVRYRIRYSITLAGFSGPTKVWMPLPREWNTLRDITLLSLDPGPTDVFIEPLNGNHIVYWEENLEQHKAHTFSQEFEISLLRNTWVIDEANVGAYGPSDPALGAYLAPTQFIQSDHPEVLRTAAAIVGNETNPYRKARHLAACPLVTCHAGNVPHPPGFLHCAAVHPSPHPPRPMLALTGRRSSRP